MADSSATASLSGLLLRLSRPIVESLNSTPKDHFEGATNISIKSILVSLLPIKSQVDTDIHASIRDFALAWALLSSSSLKPLTQDCHIFSWIPDHISGLANSAFVELSRTYVTLFRGRSSGMIGELGLDCNSVPDEKKLIVELFPQVFPILKEKIKESSIDKSAENDEFSAASARAPVIFAILAAYQFRWFVTQIEYPNLGRLCNLVIPCALTALDHWSPEVKGQGVYSFIHLAHNVNSAELGWYRDVVLDACCQNIVSADEIWHQVVEMSVVLVTLTQKSNPRSQWFERILNEMLSHLERQPRNKERRIVWLKFIDPLFVGVGLILLAHFRRIFLLFFQWMHMDDDDTILLVLKRMYTVLRVTWIRNTPYINRLVDELIILYKEASLKQACGDIRADIQQILILLQESKGLQFEAAWGKYRNNADLASLGVHLTEKDNSNLSPTSSENHHQESSTVLEA